MTSNGWSEDFFYGRAGEGADAGIPNTRGVSVARLFAWIGLVGALLAALPLAAQAPGPDPAGGTFEARCRAGVSFRWRVAGSGTWRESRSNRESLPISDRAGRMLAYDFEVDAPAGFWYRYRYRADAVRGVEFLDSGYEFAPTVQVDVRRAGVAAGLFLGLVMAGLCGLLARAGRLRRQLAQTHQRLSEAEARSGLFPVDGSLPSRIDGYDVVERLGMGGMAMVYRVRRDGHEYALKLPLPHLLEGEGLRARFAREMRLGRKLQHPNLVHIYDVNDGEGDFGYPYLVMERVSGLSLKERMRAAPLDWQGVARLGAQVLDALSYLHARGIVHRDVKPGNVMVTAAGNAKLMDFGIAHEDATQAGRLTATGDLLGTPLYLAPEQIDGECSSSDARVDVYGAGMVLYEALAGRLPWSGGDSVALVLDKLTRDPCPLAETCPDLPAPVAACVMRMIARDPEARPESAAAARDALRAAVAEARASRAAG